MISLIYDCDNTMGVPGRDVDDGLTLLYLLGCPEVELLGVTCAFGNDTQEVVYRTTSGLLRAWGRADIPVLRGAEGPADRASPAADFLADAARRRPGELAVLATGSLSNLLGAEEADPGFFARVRTFALMGGVTGPLVVGERPMAELNFSCDPQAALAVLSQGRRVAVATAQNCLDAYCPMAECTARLAESGSPAAAFLQGALSHWFGENLRQRQLAGFVNWDTVAAALLVHPELFTLGESVITPSAASLAHGELLGDGPALPVRLPRICCPEAYRRHVYDTILSAPIAWRPELL